MSSFLTGLHAEFGVPRDAVVGLVERATGSHPNRLDRVMRGYDNEVYRVRLTDGTTVYARIRRSRDSNFADEAWAMEQARDAGVPVPKILALDAIPDEAGVRHAMVLARADGRQLAAVLPTLSPADRWTAMTNVGRILARVHSVRTPGIWRRDDNGDWPDPAELRRGWIADRMAERVQLAAAGLRAAEVDRTIELLGTSPDTPAGADPVLCHGDVSPEHVFVEPDLTVSGIIDWGMWHGGSPIGDLAYTAMCEPEADVAAIVAGHGAGSLDDPAFRRALYLSAANQVIGHIAHHVDIGDTDGIARNVEVLRTALDQLAD